MAIDVIHALEEVMCVGVESVAPLGGGCVGNVSRMTLSDGKVTVAKQGSAGLTLEAAMLRHLASVGLPVPEVLHVDEDLLVMTWIDGPDRLCGDAEEHAADLIAALHSVTADSFGFDYDTVIGGLHQPNPYTKDWLTYFRDNRLLYMAKVGHAHGTLSSRTMCRIETLAGKLTSWLEAPAKPALIHGDLWGGNIMCKRGRIAAFIDPAIYYADSEVELAFSTLFNTFSDRFFARYREHRPIAPGFFEERRHIYNLYPLLVHVRLFGGPYVAQVDQILRRFGC